MTPLAGRTEGRYADADVATDGGAAQAGRGGLAAALEADMQVVVRRAIEHIVDAELTALLGPRYAWDAARVGYRHGTKVRTVTSPVGAVTVTCPGAPADGRPRACRMGEPGAPGLRAADAPGHAALLQVYLCGGNSRRIRGALRPLLQSRAVSRSAISRIVQAPSCSAMSQR